MIGMFMLVFRYRVKNLTQEAQGRKVEIKKSHGFSGREIVFSYSIYFFDAFSLAGSLVCGIDGMIFSTFFTSVSSAANITGVS